MLKQQVLLKFDTGEVSVVWIDKNLEAKVGMGFTGKDGRKGTIFEVYSVAVEQKDINRKWNVGGLDS